MKCANLVESNNSALDQYVTISSNVVEYREQARNRPPDCKTRTGPPDPKKPKSQRCGGTAGTSRKLAIGVEKSSQRKRIQKPNPKRKRSSVISTALLPVVMRLDGSIRPGTNFEASTAPDHRALGAFRTLKAAAAAISAAHGEMSHA